MLYLFEIYSLCYIVENMVSGVSNSPLFEACLELQEPDLVFMPSLDTAVEGNFCSIIQGIIEEIIELSNLMSRISNTKKTQDYSVSSKYLVIVLYVSYLYKLFLQ